MKIYRKLNSAVGAAYDRVQAAQKKMSRALATPSKPELYEEAKKELEEAKKEYSKVTGGKTNSHKPQFSELENAIADSDKAKLKELKAKLEKAADGTDEEFKKAQKAYDDFMDTVKTNAVTLESLKKDLQQVESKIDPRLGPKAQKALFDERQRLLDKIDTLKRFPNFYKNNSLRIFRTVKNAVAKFGEGDTVRWRSKNYEIIRVREETLGGRHLYDIESETNTVTRVKEAELQEIHLVNSLRIFRK